MLTDREIVAAMRDGNPVPEPARLADDPIGLDVLLTKISERRVLMPSTPTETTDKTRHLAPRPARWSRKPLAFAASFIVILTLVGIGALVFRGGAPDVVAPTTTATATSSTVPDSTTAVVPTTTTAVVPTTTIADAAAFPAGEFVTYGLADGIPEGCVYLIAIGEDGAYVLGECGLLGLDGSSFEFLTAVPLGSLEDLELGPDGSAWIGQVDVNVHQWTGGRLIEHAFESPNLAVAGDGSVWARAFDDRQVVRYDGSEWVDEAEPGEAAQLEAGPDGTLWARVNAWVTIGPADINVGSLLSFDGDSWTVHETPEATMFDIDGFTPSGAIVLHAFDTASETSVYLIGDDAGWTRHELVPPTLDEFGLEPADLSPGETNDALGLSEPAVTDDGTFWFGTNYGVFSFSGEEWTRYTTEDGLVSNQVAFVEIGPDGSLWFGSDEGVTRYLPTQ